MNAMTHALRWCVYLIHWLAFSAYGLLQFSSKPGSRSIVPVVAAGAAYYFEEPLDAFMSWCVQQVDWHHLPASPAALYPAITVAAVLAACVYFTVARHSWRARRAFRFWGALVGGMLRILLKLAVLAAAAFAVAWYLEMPIVPEIMRRIHTATLPQAGMQTVIKTARELPLSDVLLVVALGVASCVYAALSRILATVLGTFPPITRPLRPLRRLTVKNRAVKSVAVRVVVPKLPRRSALPEIEKPPLENTWEHKPEAALS